MENKEWMLRQRADMQASETGLGAAYRTLCRNRSLGSKTPEAVCRAFAALKVISKDPKIRSFLLENDPKALEQVEDALK